MESIEKLTICLQNKDWGTLTTILKPKDFCSSIPRTLEDFIRLLKVTKTLVQEDSGADGKTQLLLLKCLGNSCVDGYLPKSYSEEKDYAAIAQEAISDKELSYPYQTHFPYNGAVQWVVATIMKYATVKQRPNDDQREILRLSLQFLCNLSMSEVGDVMPQLLDKNFKVALAKLVGHDNASIARAACAFVYNMLKKLREDFYQGIDRKELMSQLIKSTMSDIQAALDITVLLIKERDYLKESYDEMEIDDKLYLLDIIHQEARTKVYNEDKKDSSCFPLDAVAFLSDKFKKRSDLILKTVDSYLKDVEPMEITIILDILCTITSGNSEESNFLKEDKSLLINCLYLLKSCHMAGKECNNAFTPAQKLSEMTLDGDATGDNSHNCTKNMQSHPSFGFKAALIRIVGNLVYDNEKNQNIVRENDGIPLLLDCCNIDAKNPLIIQWTILAVRNLCENNTENQEVIRKSTEIGKINSSVIKEMGLTLHDDGNDNAIGIVGLPKK